MYVSVKKLQTYLFNKLTHKMFKFYSTWLQSILEGEKKSLNEKCKLLLFAFLLSSAEQRCAKSTQDSQRWHRYLCPDKIAYSVFLMLQFSPLWSCFVCVILFSFLLFVLHIFFICHICSSCVILFEQKSSGVKTQKAKDVQFVRKETMI